MSNIIQIDQYRLRCSKLAWSDEDAFIASCLDITLDEHNCHIIDVRVVCRKAMKFYLDSVFRQYFTTELYSSFKNQVYSWLKGMYIQVMNDFMTDYYPKAGLPVGKHLFQHQKDTLAQSINKPHNLWALEMGMGKTLTAATLSKITQCRRTIIISPTLVKWNWYEDMTKHWGFNPLYWSILDAKPSKCIKAFQERFVVVNFEMVEKHMDYLLRDEINHIIIDEAHMLKNPKSLRSKATAKLISKSNNPRITYLTGTPVPNRINDMFSYLKMSGHSLGKNYAEFERNYLIKVGSRGGKIIGSKNLEDLRGKMSNFMIRLKSDDCLDLPPMLITNYYFEANELTDEYATELEHLKEKKVLYDTLHGHEKQKMNAEIKNNIHTLNRLVATSKVNSLKLIIEQLIEEGEKVVVFCSYKDPINQLENLFPRNSVKIDGSVASHKRQELINRFIDDDNCNVFLGNMAAAGIGINLVNAKYVFMMNFPFTPDKITQAQKRLHRPGQKSTVHVGYTIAKGTIDEHILDLMSEKAIDIDNLIDSESNTNIDYGSLPMMLFRKLLEN